MVDLTTVSKIPFLADIHILSNILPGNSTIRFLEYEDEYTSKWKNVRVKSCSRLCPIKCHHHPKFRPAIFREIQTYLGFYQLTGLQFRRQRLLFVSCHKEQAHWWHSLKNWFSCLIFTHGYV